MLDLLRFYKSLSSPGLAGKGVTSPRMEMSLPWATSSSAWPLLWNFLSLCQAGISCIANGGCCFFASFSLRNNPCFLSALPLGSLRQQHDLLLTFSSGGLNKTLHISFFSRRISRLPYNIFPSLVLYWYAVFPPQRTWRGHLRARRHRVPRSLSLLR